MTHTQLIDFFPSENSVLDRMLLLSPEMFHQLLEKSVHKCRMFLLITRGSITIKKNISTMRVEANHLVDMLAWEPTYFESISDDLVAWCLLPNYLFTNESLDGMKPADSELFKDRLSISMLGLSGEECAVMDRQLNMLHEALVDTGHFYRIELCRSYFRSFMLEYGNIVLHKRNAGFRTSEVETRQDQITRSFLKLVWKHYLAEHNVEFYADSLCLSTKHLSRVIREKLGKTPYSVIRDELLQRAVYLLKNPKMSIQDISTELHFSEMAAFCKFLKKNKEMSPSAFRRRECGYPEST